MKKIELTCYHKKTDAFFKVKEIDRVRIPIDLE